MTAEKQQFNVYLPPDLVREVKHQAIDEQLSMSDWAERVFRTCLAGAAAAPSEREAAHATSAPPLLATAEEQIAPQSEATSALSLLPIVHVQDLARAVAFYRKLGAQPLFDSRDGDWAQLRFGDTELGLLAHAPSEGEGHIELTFASTEPLEALEARLREAGVSIVRGASDEGFGFQLQVQDADGVTVKINQLEPELYG